MVVLVGLLKDGEEKDISLEEEILMAVLHIILMEEMAEFGVAVEEHRLDQLVEMEVFMVEEDGVVMETVDILE